MFKGRGGMRVLNETSPWSVLSLVSVAVNHILLYLL